MKSFKKEHKKILLSSNVGNVWSWLSSSDNFELISYIHAKDPIWCKFLAIFFPQLPQPIKAMLNFECLETGNTLSIENNSFFDASAGHIHFARIKINSNDWEETIFTSTRKKNEFSFISGKNQQSSFEVFLII